LMLLCFVHVSCQMPKIEKIQLFDRLWCYQI
jgi:hypothetical protein